MHVDRTFKGKLAKEIELFDDGMCDGPDLRIGRQYLMYTSRFLSGEIPARGCTRSRAIEYADEDLAFLKAYAAGKSITEINGTVRFLGENPDESELRANGRRPMKDVRVSLTTTRREYRTRTDTNGKYSFRNLPPGPYEIRAELDGYIMNGTPWDITLHPGGCAVASLVMTIDRRVDGADGR